MGQRKHQIRVMFRSAVFERDQALCRVCGAPAVDAHHIMDRTLLPGGGYVLVNGISLCGACHEKAEVFHRTGTPLPGYAPDDLYARIGSSHAWALRDSQVLHAALAGRGVRKS
jgi:5-methylcytosine-specific restriction endonuclease McrA